MSVLTDPEQWRAGGPDHGAIKRKGFGFRADDDTIKLLRRAHAARADVAASSEAYGETADRKLELRRHWYDVAARHMLQMTGRHMALAHRPQYGLLCPAASERERTARMKAAAGRWVDRTGYIAR